MAVKNRLWGGKIRPAAMSVRCTSPGTGMSSHGSSSKRSLKPPEAIPPVEHISPLTHQTGPALHAGTGTLPRIVVRSGVRMFTRAGQNVFAIENVGDEDRRQGLPLPV